MERSKKRSWIKTRCQSGNEGSVHNNTIQGVESGSRVLANAGSQGSLKKLRRGRVSLARTA